ncbi:hypothetical protein PR003_g32035 [Phytophthora rubi]|uniref:Uncharacterized protein n=1 Tax=Phytophthora rubi TaxID=129364 RepID=A0A6A4B222_9STRA|nr:hypothetical protein PF003_g34238 [Phytophthora fragariae]KAE9266690.1 hypothetical protein PR003_g32035 [Phytophthora rubi]
MLGAAMQAAVAASRARVEALVIVANADTAPRQLSNPLSDL